MRLYRQYLTTLGLTVPLVLAAVIGLNVGADPYLALRADTEDPLAPYRRKSLHREGKAEVARNGRFDVLLLGDSRVQYGLDPDHPAVTAQGRAWNLAIAGGTMHEASRLIELTLRQHTPRLVIWGFDPEFIRQFPARLTRAGYATSWMNPELNRPEYYRQRLLGWQDIAEAVREIGRAAFRPHVVLAQKGLDPAPVPLCSATVMTRDLRTAEQYLRGDRLPEESGLPELRDSLERMVRKGTRVILFFPPMHAVCHEIHFRREERRAEVERTIRDLVRCAESLSQDYPDSPPVEVWDFQGLTEFHADPIPPDSDPQLMPWYRDPLHIRRELGDIVLSRMLEAASEPRDFGVRLSSEMLDGHFAELRRRRVEYARKHPEQIRIVNAVMTTVQ